MKHFIKNMSKEEKQKMMQEFMDSMSEEEKMDMMKIMMPIMMKSMKTNVMAEIIGDFNEDYCKKMMVEMPSEMREKCEDMMTRCLKTMKEIE